MPTSPGQVPDQLATVRIGALVREQAVEDVVRVLPDGLGDDQRLVGIDVAEDLHAFLLIADEAVLFVLLVRVAADELVALGLECGGEGLLHRGLGGPALLVGGEAEVAVDDELKSLCCGVIRLVHPQGPTRAGPSGTRLFSWPSGRALAKGKRNRSEPVRIAGCHGCAKRAGPRVMRWEEAHGFTPRASAGSCCGAFRGLQVRVGRLLRRVERVRLSSPPRSRLGVAPLADDRFSYSHDAAAETSRPSTSTR